MRIKLAILAVKLKMSNQDRMLFGDFSVNFESISWNFVKAIFYQNPNSGEKNRKIVFNTSKVRPFDM